MSYEYGTSVRDRLLVAIHDIAVVGFEADITEVCNDELEWQIQSVNSSRGKIACQAQFKGDFPANFVIKEGHLSIDDGDTSICARPGLAANYTFDPFAADILNVIHESWLANSQYFASAASMARQRRLAKEASMHRLVTLKAATSGNILVA